MKSKEGRREEEKDAKKTFDARVSVINIACVEVPRWQRVKVGKKIV